jgi:ABC-type antimicrobial peptide transport system permease subunit
MFFPFLQSGSYLHGKAGFLSMMLVTRTSGPSSNTAAAIREQIRSLDPDVPITAIQNMEQVVDDALWQQRMETSVLTGLAALALVLAVVGIYAVMSYVVSGRTQEIGIRMALGAKHADVLRMVLAGSMRPVAGGLAAGLIGAAGLTRLMTTMLYGVTPADPVVLAGATLILGAVAMVAALDPARRAASVDPLIALREE